MQIVHSQMKDAHIPNSSKCTSVTVPTMLWGSYCRSSQGPQSSLPCYRCSEPVTPKKHKFPELISYRVPHGLQASHGTVLANTFSKLTLTKEHRHQQITPLKKREKDIIGYPIVPRFTRLGDLKEGDCQSSESIASRKKNTTIPSKLQGKE